VSPDAPASSWLLSNIDLIPRAGRALDVACGRGRHALLLAERGLAVVAVDRDEAAIEGLRTEAARRLLPLAARVVDLEATQADLGLGEEAYDVVVVFHYLHRPLFPALLRALAPGALLIYETFTVDQARLGKPTNPDFLLQHGELRQRLGSLTIVRERDGVFEGRHVAAVVARKG
jgi:SAM-dependent methyltransferase